MKNNFKVFCLFLPIFKARLGIISFLLIGINSFSQVVINEYSCSNFNSIQDNFNEFEDWVELYNSGAASVNLSGYYLSDRATNPTKWAIGNVSIPASGFLRIWCSGRGITTGTQHASFKLTQTKPESLLFSDPSGSILDSLTLRPAQVSHSRGRTTDGAGTWSVFLNPTPGSTNQNPYQEYATQPVMNVAPGFYSSNQNVSISTPDPNITIRYTTNGSTPTSASAIYSGPILVSSTKVIRARAFSSNNLIPESFVESNTYFINSNHTTEVLSIFGDQITILLNGNTSTPECGMEYFDATGTLRTEIYGEANKHGNDSWAYPQRGIDVITRDEFGYNYALLHQLFNSKTRTEFQRVILKPAANDNYNFGQGGNLGPAHIRDAYVHALSEKAGLHMDGRTWAPAVLYVNGQYWGLYEIREKVDDADFTDYYFKTDRDSLQFLKTWGNTWADYGGNQAIADWNSIRTFIVNNNMAVQSNFDYADSLFNVKSLTDYVILNSLTVCSDWLNWNTAWWRGINSKAKKRKWRYTLWDMDATFDHYINYTGVPSTSANADPCDPQTLNNPGNQGHIPILNSLLNNPGFKQYYVMRYFDLMNGELSCARMVAVLDSMINVIGPEMPGQIAKWGGTMNGWQKNVSDLRNFILARCTAVVSGYSPCNGATGPYQIKVDVQPPGAGTVEINSLLLNQFVWSGTYPGGVNVNLTAHSGGSYCFDHWEFQNHTPQPGIGDTTVNVNLTTTDSIIAHFSLGINASVTATDSIITCGDSTQLLANSGSGFIWSPSTGLSNTTAANPIANPTVTTTYTLIASNACGSDTTTFTLTVNGGNNISITSTGTTVCEGDSAQLQVSAGNNFIWSPSTGLSNTTISNPIAVPSVNTTYTVIASDACGADTASIAISVSPIPVPIVSSNHTICSSSSANLAASGGTNYVWSPTTGLSCFNCPTPVANPASTTMYTVQVLNALGCKSSDSVTVVVSGECPEIYIPTGFSPNGDNNNDMLYIFGEISELEYVVYNRWGQVVFSTTDPKIGWDGKFKGKLVQSGVYAYKVRVVGVEGQLIEKSGNLTIVR